MTSYRTIGQATKVAAFGQTGVGVDENLGFAGMVFFQDVLELPHRVVRLL